jgi:hypothetical protein
MLARPWGRSSAVVTGGRDSNAAAFQVDDMTMTEAEAEADCGLECIPMRAEREGQADDTKRNLHASANPVIIALRNSLLTLANVDCPPGFEIGLVVRTIISKRNRRTFPWTHSPSSTSLRPSATISTEPLPPYRVVEPQEIAPAEGSVAYQPPPANGSAKA